MLFAVSYSIVTPESAEAGDVAECGMLDTGLSLRDAVDLVQGTRTSRVGGVECVECDESPVIAPRWVQVSNGMEYETGACETRALHMPDALSDASRRRVARLLGVRHVGRG